MLENEVYATIMMLAGVLLLLQMAMINARGFFYVTVFKILPLFIGITAVGASLKLLGIL